MTEYAITLPDGLVGGTYADGARTKVHGPSVILDFVVRDDRIQDQEALLVVSRIRLDITSVQQILSNLAGLLSDYETAHGPKLGPDADQPPPD